jgi:hypothetical protein
VHACEGITKPGDILWREFWHRYRFSLFAVISLLWTVLELLHLEHVGKHFRIGNFSCGQFSELNDLLHIIYLRASANQVV